MAPMPFLVHHLHMYILCQPSLIIKHYSVVCNPCKHIIHTYIHTYIHKYIHTYIRTYVRTYILRHAISRSSSTYLCTYILWKPLIIINCHSVVIHICMYIHRYLYAISHSSSTFLQVYVLYQDVIKSHSVVIHVHTYIHTYVHIDTFVCHLSFIMCMCTYVQLYQDVIKCHSDVIYLCTWWYVRAQLLNWLSESNLVLVFLKCD
jgi:hypothetical protein